MDGNYSIIDEDFPENFTFQLSENFCRHEHFILDCVIVSTEKNLHQTFYVVIVVEDRILMYIKQCWIQFIMKFLYD